MLTYSRGVAPITCRQCDYARAVIKNAFAVLSRFLFRGLICERRVRYSCRLSVLRFRPKPAIFTTADWQPDGQASWGTSSQGA